MERDPNAKNLLRDVEAWLNENKNGDLHISATLPSLANLIQNMTDPEASEAFQSLLNEMEILRTDNNNLHSEVTTLKEEVDTLRTLFFITLPSHLVICKLIYIL